MSAAITLSGVGKRYVKYEDTPLLLSTVRNIGRRTRRSALWALRGVDLDIGPGESVGIVGRNGAGKSTLLQLLGGVTAPTEGVVRVRGRVAPLISVGVGFHPELTGRENVYVNATILGLSEREIDRKFDEIVAFSEIESFIDTPVKFYSSGMFVRLGFAVAIEARPDILLVDEVLAVGDFPFQMKSFRRMQQVRENGTTLVVVSHNLFSLGALCDRGIVVSGGRLAFDGSMFDAIGRYHQETPAPSEGQDDASTGRTLVPGVAEVTGVELVGSPGHAPGHVQAGETVTIRVGVQAHRDVPRPFVGLIVLTESMDMCVYSDNNHSQPCPALSAGDVASYEVTFAADLPTGTYAVRTLLHELVAEGDMVGLARSSTLRFYVSGRPLVGGVTDLRARFAPAASGPP